MEIYYVICRALSWGLLIGFFLGGFKLMAGRKEYTEKQVTELGSFVKNKSSLN